MSSRKMKKSFPLNEFSILFSENVNAILKNDTDAESIFDLYPNNEELYKIAKSVGNSLRIIISQEAHDKAHVVDKKEFMIMIRQLPCDSLKFFKRTGFKDELLKNAKTNEHLINVNTIVFITELMSYRMMIDSSRVVDLKKYVERNRFHKITDSRKDQTVTRSIFQNQKDVSLLKLKVLIYAVYSELSTLKI